MKEIKLTKGKVALVDDEDFERVSALRWYARLSHCTWYAVRTDSQGKTIRMHRFILGLSPSDPYPDHKDGNGLNNTRKNLRPATRSQNAQNSRIRADNKSGFKGVSWNAEHGKWVAQIGVARRTMRHLGYFNSRVLAARAYDAAARKQYGEFARLNFPRRSELQAA